ncbi:MAG: hypothetical protein ACOX50_02200 [Patescibacteria group bacterium]|jgi:hypothetical protein
MLFEGLIIFLVLFLLKKQSFLWLLLPICLVYDFWQLRPLGTTGLRVLVVCGIFWFVLGFRRADSSKLRL